jgi:4-amino-4-deoxy-L-arabinose transferase
LGFGIFLAALLYLAPLLLDAPLTDPDEGLHAAISQEMVERGDWIVPRFLGGAFLDKPILFFWTQAASIHAFGMSTAAARLPGMVFALLGIVTTGWLAKTLFRGQGTGGSGQEGAVGWVAAGCYATMVLPFLLAQAPVHDIALVPFTNLALGFLWCAGRDSGLPPRRAGAAGAPALGVRDSLLAGIVLGLSILTKGLEGLAIVGAGYALYLVLARALTWRLVARGALVVAIALLAALPWYLAMNAREPGYLHYYFVERHLLGFATQTQEHSGQPWWFYLPLVVGGGLPWVLFTRGTSLKGLSDRSEVPQVLISTWLVGAVVLLTLSQSKAVTYILPAMPAIAILAAASVPSVRVWRRVAIASTAIYLVALVFVGPSVARERSARDLAAYFNGSGRLPATIFVFDQRVSFVYYLRPDVRRQLHTGQIQSVSVEQLAAMQPFPHDAVVTVPADIAESRLSRIPPLAHARRDAVGRYLVVSR